MNNFVESKTYENYYLTDKIIFISLAHFSIKDIVSSKCMIIKKSYVGLDNRRLK